MLKLGRFTKVKVLFLVLVFVFNFDLFKFSAAILEKGLFRSWLSCVYNCDDELCFQTLLLFVEIMLATSLQDFRC